MPNRGQIKVSVSENLNDAGQTFFTDTDLNDSLQDAYDDIVILTQCRILTATLSWQDRLSYYTFSELGIDNYLGTIAIFNNVTNQYLDDSLSIRDFDRLRIDWETWIGTPKHWAPISPTRIAICAKYQGSGTGGAFNPGAFSNAYYIGNVGNLGTFDLTYAATAPTFTADTDVPLISTDNHQLLEYYATADQLESAGEVSKAAEFWEKYYVGVDAYKARVKNICKTDLLMRV